MGLHVEYAYPCVFQFAIVCVCPHFVQLSWSNDFRFAEGSIFSTILDLNFYTFFQVLCECRPIYVCAIVFWCVCVCARVCQSDKMKIVEMRVYLCLRLRDK